MLGTGEARAAARILLEDGLGVTPTKLALGGDRVLEPETESRYSRYVERITKGEPVQYVLGTARFMGMDFKVTPDTLIPRPETAELVDLITDRYRTTPDLRVADLGTGTGCIAIALARAMPFARVTAVDISDGALAVARENSNRLAKITLLKADILGHLPLPVEPYNIIVSNPPYIALSEESLMEARVKHHEPRTALFVPDASPLMFYEAIAAYAVEALDPCGRLYFEINPLFVKELCAMLGRYGFETEIVRDSYGKERFAMCSRS